MTPDGAADTVPDRELAILGFHKAGRPSAGGWDSWFYVPEDRFVDFLRVVRDSAWRVIGAAELVQGLDAPDTLPGRSVLLTFDDGFRSVLEVAAPVLRRFGFPAVVFVPTDFVGRRNDFDNGAEALEPICDWDDLRALSRLGVSVQSHGASHRAYSRLAASEQEDDLRRSKQVLEARLGTPVEVFAFPYGDAGHAPADTAALLQRAGYRAACMYGGGPMAMPVRVRFGLERVPMGPDTDLAGILAR